MQFLIFLWTSMRISERHWSTYIYTWSSLFPLPFSPPCPCPAPADHFPSHWPSSECLPPEALLSFPWGFSIPYQSLLPSSLTSTHTHSTLFKGLCKIRSTKPHVLDLSMSASGIWSASHCCSFNLIISQIDHEVKREQWALGPDSVPAAQSWASRLCCPFWVFAL